MGSAREDRAIAALLRGNAEFQPIRAPDGSKAYNLVMYRCDNNDELLRFVPSIKSIKGIDLAARPLNEAGMLSLRKVEGLLFLNVRGAHLSNEQYLALEREMKPRNPGLEMSGSYRWVELK
jgi:hypothetical protein